MKYYSYIFLLLVLSCSSKNKNTGQIINAPEEKALSNKAQCFYGKINDNIPVFLCYQAAEDIAVGELYYLNTAAKRPLKIIGKLQTDNSFSFLEFDKSGTITGILYGTQKDKNLVGNWLSPSSDKELSFAATAVDSNIFLNNIEPISDSIFGNYSFEYGEDGDGAMGNLTLERLDENLLSMSISALTNAPARNIADLEIDSIKLVNNEFTYQIPNNPDCAFKVKIYKDFLIITYTKGNCQGQFGHNASVEGIYVKTK